MNNDKYLHFKRLPKKALASAIGVAAVLAGPAPVYAEVMIEEVMVTATRRATSVQDVPYNISAVTGDDLATKGITGAADLFRSLPGVSFTDQGPRSGVNNSTLILRGINADSPSRSTSPFATAPVVSTYLNETPLFVNLRLKDIERVEVLRGPQGTLYGSGSLGGSVRYIFNKPDFDGFAGELSGSLSQTENGDGQNWEGDLILNIPVSDTLALRFNAGRVDNAGYIDMPNAYVLSADRSPVLANGASDPVGDAANFAASQPVTEKREGTNNADTDSYRLALRWQPTDDWDINIAYQVQDDEVGDSQTISYLTTGNDDLKNTRVIEEPFERDVEVFSLDVEYDLGFATATASYSDYSSEGKGESDFTDLYTGFGIYGSGPRNLFINQSSFSDEGEVLEIRLASNSEAGDRFDWVVGAFAFDQEFNGGALDIGPGYHDTSTACYISGGGFPDCGGGTLFGVSDFNGEFPIIKDQLFVSNQDNSFEDRAIFGELTWHVSDAWQVTAGARYFEQEFATVQSGGILTVPDTTSVIAHKFSDDDVLFKLNTSFELSDDTSIYATWSEGFRRGGANGLPPSTFVFGVGLVDTNPSAFNYDSDRAENREIGIKGVLAERFTYTLSYYDIEMEDFQVNSLCTGLSLLCALNVGEANSRGVEFDISGRLTDNLEVNFAYAYTDAKLTSISDEVRGFIADGTTTFGVNEGSDLPGTPDHSLSVGVLYYQDLSAGMQLIYGLNGAYTGEQTGTIDDNNVDVDSYSIWNASVTLDADNWDVSLYANNFTDERGINAILRGRDSQGNSVFFGETAAAWISTPRTIGLSGRYRF